MNRNTSGRAGRSTAVYKNLSNIHLKDVNNQRFNQSYHDTRNWYHRTSIECLQAPSLRSGSPGACSQAIRYKTLWDQNLVSCEVVSRQGFFNVFRANRACLNLQVFESRDIKDMFTRREGYPRRWVTLALTHFPFFSSSCLQGSWGLPWQAG